MPIFLNPIDKMAMDFANKLQGDVIAFGGGGTPPAPAAPPPPPPPPEPPKAEPTVDTAGDEAAAAKKSRLKSEGRSSTILTSGQGDTAQADVNKKVLLGQ